MLKSRENPGTDTKNIQNVPLVRWEMGHRLFSENVWWQTTLQDTALDCVVCRLSFSSWLDFKALPGSGFSDVWFDRLLSSIFFVSVSDELIFFPFFNTKFWRFLQKNHRFQHFFKWLSRFCMSFNTKTTTNKHICVLYISCGVAVIYREIWSFFVLL